MRSAGPLCVEKNTKGELAEKRENLWKNLVAQARRRGSPSADPSVDGLPARGP